MVRADRITHMSNPPGSPPHAISDRAGILRSKGLRTLALHGCISFLTWFLAAGSKPRALQGAGELMTKATITKSMKGGRRHRGYHACQGCQRSRQGGPHVWLGDHCSRNSRLNSPIHLTDRGPGPLVWRALWEGTGVQNRIRRYSGQTVEVEMS